MAAKVHCESSRQLGFALSYTLPSTLKRRKKKTVFTVTSNVYFDCTIPHRPMQLLLILKFLRVNLFLNLCNHPLLAVQGLVSSSLPSFFWKSSYRVKAFCRNTLLSMSFYSYLSPRNFRIFPRSLTLYYALQQ